MRSSAAPLGEPYIGGARGHPARPFVLRAALVVAVLVLIVLVAVDLNAYANLPTKVTITGVDWRVGNVSLGNQSGYRALGGHEVHQNLLCEIFCVPFDRASVNPPFVVVSSTFAYPWYEYVNLTIRAPDSAYSGPLVITLSPAAPF